MLDNQEDDRVRQSWFERIKGAYLTVFDGFVVGGSRSTNYLLRLGVSGMQIRAGYDCVDNTAIKALVGAARHDASLGPRHGYLLCVSRFVPKKNLVGLVRAYARYRQRLGKSIQPWPLVMVGDGPDRPAVLRVIHDSGLDDSVVLPGAVDSLAVMCNYYAHARAFILPSTRSEQWGLVVNEAMAASLPVLVSDRCGCAPELVIDSVNGFRFDPEDAEALASRIGWLHEHQDALDRMGRESQRIVSQFSPDSFATNVLTLVANSQRQRSSVSA
jgi:glycosyltransferase involved in cell wall biosynthesis